jgi:hypothetical protein
MLGAWRDGACGLMFDGKPDSRNETTVKGKFIVNGKENRVVLRMAYTARDQVAITVALNGKRIISWRGKISAFQKRSEKTSFGVVTQLSSVVFHAIQVRLIPPERSRGGS